MVNLYVMQDRVSGVFGAVFESSNDESVKRDFLNIASNPNIPDYAVSDTVIVHLGSFDQDVRNPSIISAGVPRIVFRGDDIEIRKVRERISLASVSESVESV